MAITVTSTPPQNGTLTTSSYYEITVTSDTVSSVNLSLLRVRWNRNDGTSAPNIVNWLTGSAGSGTPTFSDGSGWSPTEVGSSGWEGTWQTATTGSTASLTIRFRPVGGWAGGSYDSTNPSAIGWVNSVNGYFVDGTGGFYLFSAPSFNFTVPAGPQTIFPSSLTSQVLPTGHTFAPRIEPASLVARSLGQHRVGPSILFANVREYEGAGAVVISGTPTFEGNLVAAVPSWRPSLSPGASITELSPTDLGMTAGPLGSVRAQTAAEFDRFDAAIIGVPPVDPAYTLDTRFVVAGQEALIRATRNRQGFDVYGEVGQIKSAVMQVPTWQPRFIRRGQKLVLVNGTTVLGRFTLPMGVGYFEVRLTSTASRSVSMSLTGVRPHSGIMLDGVIQVPLNQTRASLQIREPSGSTPTIIVFGPWGEIKASDLISGLAPNYTISADVSVIVHQGS